MRYIFGFLCLTLCSLSAIEPGDVIINELYFWPKGPPVDGHNETVELLVVADKVDLNGLQLTDRDIWNKASEDQCTLQDLGQGFLSSVRSGTLLVVHRGEGTDDTDGSDFVLRFYARSSLFCNTAPSTNAFQLSNHEDNMHLLHMGKQIDFIKYKASNSSQEYTFAAPGSLEWEKGEDNFIPVGKVMENVGIRFLGNKPDLNNFTAAWKAYPVPYIKEDGIGKPNGGANSDWIEQLRKSTGLEVAEEDETWKKGKKK